MSWSNHKGLARYDLAAKTLACAAQGHPLTLTLTIPADHLNPDAVLATMHDWLPGTWVHAPNSQEPGVWQFEPVNRDHALARAARIVSTFV